MNRLLPAVVLGLFVACASSAPATKSSEPGAPAPAVEKQKIVNISHFDVGSCAAPSPTLPDPLNPEGVVGALVLARPSVLECFVDPKNRGPEAESSAAVKATVSDSGAAYEVTGTNLTPAGTACIEAALKKLPFKAVEKGTAPVVGQAEFRHGPTSPAVKLGVNAASDVAGAIRLGETGWCECWNALGANAPPTFKATLKLVPAKPPEVTFEPTTDADATKLIACLTPKLQAIPPITGTNELTVHYPFLLVNSSAREESAGAPPELQFIQLDLIRAQKAADVAVKIGVRTNALKTYDALVAKYKAKPSGVLIKDLKDKCAAMVGTDEAWIASLKTQADVDGRSLALASSLKATNPKWADAEAAAQAQVTASAGDVKKAEDVKTADMAVCPKERK
jgi:hypothetical protein